MVRHPDPDDLTLLAMGEPIDMAIDAHIAECGQCRVEVESMRRTVELAELSNYGEGTRQPGEHIWNAIAAELGFGATQTTNGSSHAPQAGAGSPWPVDLEAAPATAGLDEQARTREPDRLETIAPGNEVPTPPAPGQAEQSPEGADNPPVSSTAPPTLRAVPGTGTPTPAPAADRARRWPRWAAPIAALLIGAAHPGAQRPHRRPDRPAGSGRVGGHEPGSAGARHRNGSAVDAGDVLRGVAVRQ